MICNNCKKEISDGLSVCPECGAKLGEIEKTVGLWTDPINIPLIDSGATEQLAKNTASAGVGFGEAIKLFFKKYADFTGRSVRSEFWWAFLFNSIVNIVIIGVSIFVPFLAILGIAFIVPSISICARRFHDVGKSGWHTLLLLIPIVGVILLLIDFVKESDKDNAWGPKPGTQASTGIQETVDERIYRLSREHEPKNVNTPEGRQILDMALSKIIPTYSSETELANAIVQCNPQDIKANIDAMDMDTLLVVRKALQNHIDKNGETGSVSMVLRGVDVILRDMV